MEVVIGGNTDVATQASQENHTVMFVCKLENNGIDSSPMYVSETSDVSMEIPYMMPTDLADASLIYVNS